MSTARMDNRTKLIRAARKTAFQHGFARTSIADIAKESGVPLGNVYYYFKTKEAIGEAIIEDRFAQLRDERHSWEERGSPKERLCAFVDSVRAKKDNLARGGCSIGTLCSELN